VQGVGRSWSSETEKKKGRLNKRGVNNTDMLNITPTIVQGFSWGPHTSATPGSSCTMNRHTELGLVPQHSEPLVASALAFSSCTSHLCRLAVPAEGNGN